MQITSACNRAFSRFNNRFLGKPFNLCTYIYKLCIYTEIPTAGYISSNESFAYENDKQNTEVGAAYNRSQVTDLKFKSEYSMRFHVTTPLPLTSSLPIIITDCDRVKNSIALSPLKQFLPKFQRNRFCRKIIGLSILAC